MKGSIYVICKKDYEGIYEGDEVVAVYAYSAKHRKSVYHIASLPISDKVFDEHFEIKKEELKHS